MPVDELIARNADPIWLHQHEMWELIDPAPETWYSTDCEASDLEDVECTAVEPENSNREAEESIPF